MPSTTIPAAVPPLLRALEARDMAAVQAAFAPDAAIHDEGEVVRGAAGVERWATRVFGYHATFTIDDAAHDAGETVVTTTVSGSFPGSPLVFHWHLAFAGDRIASLRITL